jgi:glycosyltransferase involved in cell wall biosynthesis
MSILTNYLQLLKESNLDDKYIILVPDSTSYLEYKRPKIELIYLPKLLSHKLFFPLVYLLVLPLILYIKKVDVVFNLADIPIRSKIKQVFLFDWPYAVYPESEVWKMMSCSDYLLKKIKLYFFKNYSQRITCLIAQSETMKQHLIDLYNIKNIQVVPNAVSVDNLSGGSAKYYNLPSGTKFLYLSHYYTHKNIEIFLELGKKIKAKKLNFKLIITLESDQHPGARKFINDLKNSGLTDVIINVGAVKMEHVPSLYQQCDALLMPTLLESFSGTYVEAMFHKKPIFTSNYDFASDVCKNAAVYFNPHDADDILNTLIKVFESESTKEGIVIEGTKVLNHMPGWNLTFEMYNKIIFNQLNYES